MEDRMTAEQQPSRPLRPAVAKPPAEESNAAEADPIEPLPAETVIAKASAAQTPGPAGESKKARVLSGVTGNALVAGVVSAIVAGLISLLVTRVQDDDAASQAAASQQAQAAEALQTAASSLYQSTINVYNFQRQCVSIRSTWQECGAEALQVYSSYNSVMTAFGAASSDLADKLAAQLAGQLESEASNTISAQSAADANTMWYDMVATYADLIGYCGGN